MRNLLSNSAIFICYTGNSPIKNCDSRETVNVELVEYQLNKVKICL